jgi:cyclopropane fatty-acyl-phospholipid synthase-like methyltransferase
MKNKEKWYEEWFDTKYYQLLYEHRSFGEAEQFIKKLVQKLKLKSETRILDMACGNGRHALALAKYGFRVTGIDLSSSNIQWAKQFESEKLKFLQSDMRVPLNEKFDLILNLFSSFGYFFSDEENEKVIQSVSFMLADDGNFLLDYLNVYQVFVGSSDWMTVEKDNVVFKIQKIVNKNEIIKNIVVEDSGNQYKYHEYLKKYDLSFFEKIFQKFRLKIECIWGDYELNEFDIHSSPRLIMVAKKV